MNRTIKFLILSVLAFFAVSTSFSSVQGQNQKALLNVLDGKAEKVESLVNSALDAEAALQTEINGQNRQQVVNTLTNKLDASISKMNGPLNAMGSISTNIGNPDLINEATNLSMIQGSMQSYPVINKAAAFGSTGGGYSSNLLLMREGTETLRREIQELR